MQVKFSLQKSLFNVKKEGRRWGDRDCEFRYTSSNVYIDVTYYFWP